MHKPSEPIPDGNPRADRGVDCLRSSTVRAGFQEGLARYKQGQMDSAREAFRQVLAWQPDHPEALHLLGVMAARSGNFGEAVELMSRALAIDPGNAVAYVNCGNALNNSGQHQLAVTHYNQAIALKPDYANAYKGRGLACFNLRHYEAAADSFKQVTALQSDAAEAHFNLGLACYKLQHFQAAIASFDMVIALMPGLAEAHINRGLALHDLKHHQAAIDSYNVANALKPGMAECHFNRGLALYALQQVAAAIDSFDQAAAINPHYEYLSGERLYAKMKICDWSDSAQQLAGLTQQIQRGDKATAPFQLLALTSELPLQRQTAESYVSDRHPANDALGGIAKRNRQNKIRLGYFSANFHNHAVAYLMAGLFEQHDKNRFELLAFSFGPDSDDEMRQRVAAAFDRFIDVRGQTDQEVAQLSRHLGIDIAVDLMGFTQDHRLGIFACRAAPLQVSYLGYPGTLGADYMDYLMADPILIPEASRACYSEKIVYLPHSYQANDAKRKIADKVFTREALGLPAAGFVFCCFNNNFKITPATFDGWMRILQQVESSVLWLFEGNPDAADHLRQQARNRGVAAARLVFAKHLPLLPEHLARLRVADLFIDTLPYNAHTTASDALWAGLPVLTCMGDSFASRVAASLLTAIDLPELITTTQQDFEDLAIALATQPQRLKAIRDKLARQRLTTPLFDTQLFTRHIEDAYEQMLQRYHKDLAPDHLVVRPL